MGIYVISSTGKVGTPASTRTPEPPSTKMSRALAAFTARAPQKDLEAWKGARRDGEGDGEAGDHEERKKPKVGHGKKFSGCCYLISHA